MQTYLEKALFDSTRRNNLELCKQLIKAIKLDPNSSLSTTDNDKRSILSLAVSSGSHDFAMAMWEILKDVFSGKTNMKLLYEASARGNKELVEQLLCLAEEEGLTELLFKGDERDQQTALHLAVLNGHKSLVDFLLDQFSNKNNFNEYLNQTDKHGNTVLHCALRRENHDGLHHLINLGSEPTIKNNNNESAFNILCKLSNQEQINLFHHLDPIKQKQMLANYRKMLIDDLNSENLLAIYFKCAGLHSLQCLLIAHHEFNQLIPVLDCYKKIVPSSHKPEEMGFFLLEKDEQLISDLLFKLMPFYEYKVKQMRYAKQKMPIFQENVSTDLSLQPFYVRLSEDRGMLSCLINDMEEHINVLQNMPTVSQKNKVLSYLIPILFWVTFIALYSQLINQLKTLSNTDKDFGMNVAEVFFLFIGVMLFIGSFVFHRSLSKKEITISSHQWQPLIDRLENDLLIRFRTAKENGEEMGNSPIKSAYLRIEDNLDRLKYSSLPILGSFFRRSVPKSEVIDTLSNIKEKTRKIRDDLNQSQRPLSSLFKKVEVAIQINDQTQTNLEIMRLLAV